ncbi:MAG: hypothetical protein ACLFPQ_06620 [Candidatus Woesearchaeota archaeon]
MDQMKINIINSFRNVKSDIVKLQRSMISLTQTVDNLRANQEKLIEKISKLESSKTPRQANKKDKIYVASKSGNKFHDSLCPYAQNIKPKSKVTFKTKNDALNQGYKPCTCIK